MLTSRTLGLSPWIRFAAIPAVLAIVGATGWQMRPQTGNGLGQAHVSDAAVVNEQGSALGEVAAQAPFAEPDKPVEPDKPGEHAEPAVPSAPADPGAYRSPSVIIDGSRRVEQRGCRIAAAGRQRLPRFGGHLL